MNGGKVIVMSEYAAKLPVPKQVSDRYEGHTYTLTYDPAGDAQRKWVWRVKFTRTYEYVGTAASMDRAQRAARRQIRELNGRVEKGIA